MVAVPDGPIREGQPHPRGATWDGYGVNFALFSAHATRVELCLLDDSGDRETGRIELPEYTDEIWHGYMPDVHPGSLDLRLSRLWPYEPCAGHRFNPNKRVFWGSRLEPRGHQLESATTPPSTSATARHSRLNTSSSILISTGKASRSVEPSHGSIRLSTKFTCAATPSFVGSC
jgi:pullulanase/glycogen debranching enzyme